MDRLRTMLARLRAADISIFHEFKRPPYGGGNQFLLALRGELQRRGLRVEDNTISPSARACLFNSFNFDEHSLRAAVSARGGGCRKVHRVDGPVGVYRGHDDGTDARIQAANQQLADATVFQSQYSFQRHLALGLTFREPTVIMNAVDPRIFYPSTEEHASVQGRRVRLISTAWSDNPNKGAGVYRWLEEHLDWDRFDYTFVGRSPVPFARIRVVDPVPSETLAALLRQHDIYITASLHDPCSNALIEALACGLPAVYANSGGHPEIVGQAGFGFDTAEEVPALLARLTVEYEACRSAIDIPTLEEVTDRYLLTMGIEQQGGVTAA